MGAGWSGCKVSMAQLCQVIAINENYYLFWKPVKFKICYRKKPYALKMSTVAGVFENWGFSARHYLERFVGFGSKAFETFSDDKPSAGEK